MSYGVFSAAMLFAMSADCQVMTRGSGVLRFLISLFYRTIFLLSFFHSAILDFAIMFVEIMIAKMEKQSDVLEADIRRDPA